MPMPGSIVIKNVVRGFSLVHRGNPLACFSTSFLLSNKGGSSPPSLPLLRCVLSEVVG
jgi:hypothetical protein